jgi:Zn-dependent protease with chaperone function
MRIGVEQERMMVEGRYQPRGSQNSVPAKLWGVSGDLRLLVEGDTIVRAPHAVELRQQGAEQALLFHDGSRFLASADAPLGELLQSQRTISARLGGWKLSWNLVFVSIFAVALLFAAVYRIGLPAAASAAARATPPEILTTIDNLSLVNLEAGVFKPSKASGADRARVQKLFDELAALSGQKEPPLRLLMRDGGTMGANAVALPGGTIVVTDQLVALARSDDEIAGVIAHEIGHVTARHSLNQIYRTLGISVMTGLLIGDGSALADLAARQALQFQSRAFSREFERDADRTSVELMVKAGRNPLAFVALLGRMSAGRPEAENTGWLSTHPGTADRERDVVRHAERVGAK